VVCKGGGAGRAVWSEWCWRYGYKLLKWCRAYYFACSYQNRCAGVSCADNLDSNALPHPLPTGYSPLSHFVGMSVTSADTVAIRRASLNESNAG